MSRTRSRRLPQLDVGQLHAAVILAEELNFTRAARRLRISQPALSQRISKFEKQHGFQLFIRTMKREAQLTEAGRAFVREARAALLHADRAIHLAREAHRNENILLVGHAPCADQDWVSTLLTVRLPQFPKLQVRLMTQFATELVRSVLADELNLALVTTPPLNPKLTAIPFAETQLCAVMPKTHPAADNDQIGLQHVANDEWILFPRYVNPMIHDAILETAEKERVSTKHAHQVLTAQTAFRLVSQGAGVAILTRPSTLGLPAETVVVRPLSDPSLSFKTCLLMRRDNGFGISSEFAKAFLRNHDPKPGPS